jgi:hypothetical protein
LARKHERTPRAHSSQENVKLRKVVPIIIGEGRNKISDKLLAWTLNELAPGDNRPYEPPPEENHGRQPA